MHSLVIGGSGFLGSAVVRCLQRRDEPVTAAGLSRNYPASARLDVAEYELLLKKIWLIHREKKIDCVYNFACVRPQDQMDFRTPWSVHVNIIGAINLLRVCENLEIPRLFHPTKPHPWLNTYTITKCAAENVALMFGERGKVEVSGLRYFNVYGPGQPISHRKMLPAFCVEALSGLPLTVFGDGSQYVDILDVDDAAGMAVWMVNSGMVNHFLDCGSGAGIQVNTVARFVNELAGNKAGIRYKPMRRGEQEKSQVVADTTRLRNCLGRRPEFKDPFKCIEDTFNYYRDHTTQEERTEAIRQWPID